MQAFYSIRLAHFFVFAARGLQKVIHADRLRRVRRQKRRIQHDVSDISSGNFELSGEPREIHIATQGRVLRQVAAPDGQPRIFRGERKIHRQMDATAKSVIDILQSKLVKRGVSLQALDYQKIEAAEKGTVRQPVKASKLVANVVVIESMVAHAFLC